jgi:hypothetical protein
MRGAPDDEQLTDGIDSIPPQHWGLPNGQRDAAGAAAAAAAAGPPYGAPGPVVLPVDSYTSSYGNEAAAGGGLGSAGLMMYPSFQPAGAKAEGECRAEGGSFAPTTASVSPNAQEGCQLFGLTACLLLAVCLQAPARPS